MKPASFQPNSSPRSVNVLSVTSGVCQDSKSHFNHGITVSLLEDYSSVGVLLLL